METVSSGTCDATMFGSARMPAANRPRWATKPRSDRGFLRNRQVQARLRHDRTDAAARLPDLRDRSEGDYEELDKTISLGDPNRAPLDSEAFDVLRKPSANLVVNLLGIGLPDRPVFFSKLLSGLVEFRSKFGRPHWIVVDEAHHLVPAESAPSLFLPGKLPGTILITAEPETLAKNALETTNTIIAIGAEAAGVISSY